MRLRAWLLRDATAVRGHLGKLPDRFVLFVGRLDPKKGIEVLFDSFAEFSASVQDLSLVIAGPDPLGLWDSLSIRAANLGISRQVFYLGLIDEISKFQLMFAAQVFVLPSISEGLSISVLEALACGTPVIASAACNMPEIRSARAGLVVTPIPSHLSRAMLEILEDDSLRNSMKRNASKLAGSRFSIESMATNMLRFYHELLS